MPPPWFLKVGGLFRLRLPSSELGQKKVTKIEKAQITKKTTNSSLSIALVGY